MWVKNVHIHIVIDEYQFAHNISPFLKDSNTGNEDSVGNWTLPKEWQDTRTYTMQGVCLNKMLTDKIDYPFMKKSVFALLAHSPGYLLPHSNIAGNI